jgi:hypothetical protein
MAAMGRIEDNMSTDNNAPEHKPVRVVEKGPNSQPITTGEWDRAEREGRLDELLKERNYLVPHEG